MTGHITPGHGLFYTPYLGISHNLQENPIHIKKSVLLGFWVGGKEIPDRLICGKF
jgi:hypothetical protein